MNLPAFTRNLFRFPEKAARFSRAAPAIEPLEARIAPATLVSPTTVTFQDKNGDIATVTISKPLFNAATVNSLFTFDTGTVNGDNSVGQQLELLNITPLGHAASGMDISITVPAVNNGPVNVGYINSSDIDLGAVSVGGDLGRIAAGDFTYARPAIVSLTVQSIGALGITTQKTGGNLNSLFSGVVGSITVYGDIDNAAIGIGGGGHGQLQSLIVTGNINGGFNGNTSAFAGSIRTQGTVGSVLVGGSIIGGGGTDSGIIGTVSAIDSLIVQGSVTGGSGTASGAILSSGPMISIEIDGNLAGGSGADSGQVGTASSLGMVIVEGSVTGGIGSLSGIILATGSIATVAITDNLMGGSGALSGQIGAGASIGTVTIGGSMAESAIIHAHLNIATVSEDTSASLGAPMANSLILTDTGSIGIINAGGITDSRIDAGGSIGAINSAGTIDGSLFIAGVNLGANFGVAGAGTFNAASAPGFGFTGIVGAGAAHIGNITVTAGASPALIENSTFLAGVHGAGADGMFGTRDDLVSTGSSVGAISAPGGLNSVWVESGNIGATTSGAIVGTTYISTDTAVTAHGIGPVTVVATIAGEGPTQGIYGSTFISNAGIGSINVTLNGVRQEADNSGITSSLFQASHAIGSITVVNNATGPAGDAYGIYGTVNNPTAFNAGLNGYGGIGDISVTLTDSGPDGNTAAIVGSDFDADVCACMNANIASIYAENADISSTAAGIVDSVFRAHGNIGPIGTTMDNGLPTAPAIEGSIFSAFGSIGAVNVFGAVTADSEGNPSLILAGYDIGKDMTFGNEDLSAGSLALHAGQSEGNVTVSGYFSGSDIAASVNPGAGYVFGAANNTNVGTGGSIGLVSLGAGVTLPGNPFTGDTSELYGIEAANFALGGGNFPIVSAFGYTSGIPVVLSVGESAGVLITNFADVG